MASPDERRWGRAKPLKAGAVLRAIRERAQLSSKELCSRICMNLGQLSDVERGIQPLSLRRAKQLADVFPDSSTEIVQAALQDKLDAAGFESLSVHVLGTEPVALPTLDRGKPDREVG